jgi:hypothetical protein
LGVDPVVPGAAARVLIVMVENLALTALKLNRKKSHKR